MIRIRCSYSDLNYKPFRHTDCPVKVALISQAVRMLFWFIKAIWIFLEDELQIFSTSANRDKTPKTKEVLLYLYRAQFKDFRLILR